MNLPNKITISRICMIPVFGAIFFIDFSYHYFVSALVFIVAACTDFVDGHIARKYNLVTNLGKFLDPIADKVLVATAFILMLTEYSIFGLWGNWIYIAASVCICVILARELIISAFRQIAASAGIVLAAEKLGKYKTTFQDGCIFFLLLSVDFSGTAGQVINMIGLVLFAVATVLTIWSGISYVVKNKAVLKDTAN